MNNNLTEKKNGESYLERMEEGTGGGLAASLRGTHWTEETIYVVFGRPETLNNLPGEDLDDQVEPVERRLNHFNATMKRRGI